MKYKHEDGTPFTKEEFLKKLETDDEFKEEFGNKGIDQIQNLINDLKTNPDSRRMLVTSWNPTYLPHMVLPPCHYGFQVYTRELSLEEKLYLLPNYDMELVNEFRFSNLRDVISDEELNKIINKSNVPKRAISLMWQQRSSDTFLGLPFNIASYGLLLEILAEIVNMVPDELIGNLGDTHLYLNHLEQAKEQISREPFELPKLNINTEFWLPGTDEGCGMGPGTYGNIDGLIRGMEINDFQIENYQSHPTIKAPLSN